MHALKSQKWLTLFLLFVCSLGHAHEQESSNIEETVQQEPEASRSEAKPGQAVTPMFDEGYWMIAPNKKMRVGGLLEIDGRFFTQSDGNHTTFLIRRARLFVTGNLYEHFNYMVMGKWDYQKAGLEFAWIESLKPSFLQVRAGLFKQPFSLEASYSDTFWDFDERSIGAINFIRIRDIGAMAYGIFAKECIEYGIGIFNGNGDKLDNNNNKDVVGRIVFYPFFTTHNILRELGLGFSGSIGRYFKNLTDTDFVTGAGTAFWKWNTAMVNARRFRLGADLEWIYRSLAIRGEYLHTSWRKVKEGILLEPFTVNSGYVESSYLLTGEEQPGNARVIPKRNLDFKGGWGAWQLAARYELCHISDQSLQAKLARGANFAKGPTLAVNWLFNPNLALKTDWQYLHFNHRLPNDSQKKFESVITMRLQAIF